MASIKLPEIIEKNKILFAFGAVVVVGGILYHLHNKTSDSQYSNIDGAPIEAIPTAWYTQKQLNDMNCTRLQSIANSLAAIAYSGSYAPFTAAKIASMMSTVIAALKTRGCAYLSSYNDIANGVWVVKGTLHGGVPVSTSTSGTPSTPKPSGPVPPGTTPLPGGFHLGGTTPVVVPGGGSPFTPKPGGSGTPTITPHGLSPEHGLTSFDFNRLW